MYYPAFDCPRVSLKPAWAWLVCYGVEQCHFPGFPCPVSSEDRGTDVLPRM